MASRTSNSLKNIASGLGLKFLMLGLQFATRTIFINNLGSVYNGINSLVSSILSFLNMTELGIGTAIVYAMYKPVADNDEEKILQYLEYYKKIYHLLGLIVFGLGIALVPFFPILAKGATDVASTTELYVIYGLYLLQSVSSFYVYTYRGGLITANQHDFRLTPINLTVSILSILLQGASLLILRGVIAFYVYVAIPIVLPLIGRIIGGIWAGKWYPYLKNKPKGKLSKFEIKELYKRVFGLAISKICTIISSSSDNIIITAFVGVTILGKYNNYQVLLLMITSFIGILFSALIPSVGNLQATGSKKHIKKIFSITNYISFFIYGICTTCYFCVIQPFVRLWIGEKNLIQDYTLIIMICLNFLSAGLRTAVNTFRDGCGLYYQGRYRPIFTVLLNVVLSIILGSLWGITGIILATLVSNLITTWWFDAYIVFKYVFEEKATSYYIDYWLKLAIVCIVCTASYFVCFWIGASGWAAVLINGFTALIISSCSLLLLTCKTREFIYTVDYIKPLTNKILRRH